MGHNITLTGDARLLGRRKEQPVPGNESYFQAMVEALMHNYRTLIGQESKGAEKTGDRTACGSSLYQNMIHGLLKNFSTFGLNQ